MATSSNHPSAAQLVGPARWLGHLSQPSKSSLKSPACQRYQPCRQTTAWTTAWATPWCTPWCGGCWTREVSITIRWKTAVRWVPAISWQKDIAGHLRIWIPDFHPTANWLHCWVDRQLQILQIPPASIHTKNGQMAQILCLEVLPVQTVNLMRSKNVSGLATSHPMTLWWTFHPSLCLRHP